MIDLLVVGGGVNGAGIARDAAGRGLSVVLCEQHDLAAHTSSASTKLIHGGLRYLEFMEFSLVRKALAEREVLLAVAPHIIYPLRFVMPHDRHLRPAWMIRIGLFLYDHLARRRSLRGSSGIDFAAHPAGVPLQERFRRGFEYSDGWVDDARLVVLNALNAYEHGADIRVRTRCVSLQPTNAGHWSATLLGEDGRSETLLARAVVNATGPWAARFLQTAMPHTPQAREESRAKHGLRLVKGSHIVVRKLFDHDYAYIFQAEDRRIIFALPYEQDYTLVGTTDVDHAGAPDAVSIDAAEIDYLCTQANRYFKRSLAPSDVIHHYSGVRPLLAEESSGSSTDARAVTRDYALELLREPAPLLNVFGGKITTFRTLAEEAVDRLAPLLGCRAKSWTSDAPLPGGDIPDGDFDRFFESLRLAYPALPHALLYRYARAYGTRVERLLAGVQTEQDLGVPIAVGLYPRELDYLMEHEWARSAEDILWRRSKLGLHTPATTAQTLQQWIDAKRAAARTNQTGEAS